ncbi:MAG TPA: alpha/beta hydrolase, partial [Marmoricola sp.]|nr:alpha/beta hydrolase [Marmoricola sp.]
YLRPMEIQRGLAGKIPYAAVGTGKPVVVFCGLWPITGVANDRLVRGALAPLAKTGDRQLVVFNRRSNMPKGFTMEDIAAEYAEAIEGEFGSQVDVLGISTGGSIAQQLAAAHLGAVRRLVLVSTAARLEGEARASQVELATHIRAGRLRAASALIGDDAAPRGLRGVTRGLFWMVGNRIITDAEAASDLATTLEAEDRFDLAGCPQIQAPTLIVGGGRDRFYPTRQFLETSALIPRSQVHIAQRSGHMSVVNSARVQFTIAGFLNA